MLSPESTASDAIVPLTGSECPFVLVLSSKTCEHRAMQRSTGPLILRRTLGNVVLRSCALRHARLEISAVFRSRVALPRT